MMISRGRRRLALAVVVTAASAGLAAGLVFSRSGSGSARAQGQSHVVAKGDFHAVTWNTEGTASLVRDPSGDLLLRFSSKFITKRAPELFVYLVKLRGEQRVYWKEVAALKRLQGAQHYAVSSDATFSPGLQVAIYCGECNQINALAPLAPVSPS
jgi:hypothetical protein